MFNLNRVLIFPYRGLLKLTTIVMVFVFPNNVRSQVLWTNYYANSPTNPVNAVDTTNDNGCFIVGSSSNLSGGNYFVYKLDSNGAETWHVYGNKFNGLTFQNYATCVVNAGDGGCLIGGILSNGGKDNLYFIRIDSSGQVLWEKTFGGINGQLVTSVIKNGNNYLCECFESGSPLKVYLLALNDNGDSLWAKNVNIGFGWSPSSFIKLQNGNFIMSGGFIDSAGIPNLAYMEIDSIGDSLNTKLYADTSSRAPVSINQTYDGGFLFSSYNYGYNITYLTKVGSAGNVIWEKVFYNSNVPVSTVIDDNNYLLSLGGFNNQIQFYLLDSLGNIRGNQNIQTSLMETTLTDNITGKNGSVLICGTTWEEVTGQQDPHEGMISKINLSAFNSINELPYDYNVQIYPNPISTSHSDLMIQANKQIKEITIVNSYNEIISKTKLNEFIYDTKLNIHLFLNHILSPGVYFLVFKMEGVNSVTKKLVVVE
jgi:hypothetical protein